MIQTLLITNPVQSTFTLHLRTSEIDEGVLVFSMEGLGPPQSEIAGVSGPNIDGFLSDSVRVGARHITLTLAIATGVDEEAVKQKIYSAFPLKRNITFRVTADTRDAYIIARVESIEANQFSKVENVVITLSCARPYFIDFVEKSVEITQAGLTHTYLGEIDTGVVFSIDFTDDIGTPIMTIVNDQYDQSMVLDFTDVLALIGGPPNTINGDAVILDTRVGQKSAIFIRSTIEYNMLSGVTFDSDWIRLGHDFKVKNILDWSVFDGPTTYVTVWMDYKELYGGV